MRIDIEFEMDAEGARDQGAALVGLAERAGDLVVDLSRVTRLDSSGIGLLIHLRKRKLEQRWRFSVENASGPPCDLLARLDLLRCGRQSRRGSGAPGARDRRDPFCRTEKTQRAGRRSQAKAGEAQSVPMMPRRQPGI